MMLRKSPAGAFRHKCPVCNKIFKPMTAAQWRENWERHLALSIRHRKYLALQTIDIARSAEQPA